MVNYYVVLSGNILEQGEKIVGQMIINSGTVTIQNKIKSYDDFEMIKEHMWKLADPTVKSFTNKSNVHISFIQKIKQS